MGEKKNDRRTFCGILYLETETYSITDALLNMEQYFDEWAYIVHDRDFNEDGTKKKDHIHWFGRASSPRQFQAVSNALGVPVNYIQAPRSEKGCIRYMIHADNRKKAVYQQEEIVTNMAERVEQFLASGRESSVQATILYEFIINSRCDTMTELLGFALANDVYAELRRGATLWRSMLQENAIRFEKV